MAIVDAKSETDDLLVCTGCRIHESKTKEGTLFGGLCGKCDEASGAGAPPPITSGNLVSQHKETRAPVKREAMCMALIDQDEHCREPAPCPKHQIPTQSIVPEDLVRRERMRDARRTLLEPNMCQHKETRALGLIGDRFKSEWCIDCGAIREWDNHVAEQERAEWILPMSVRRQRGTDG